MLHIRLGVHCYATERTYCASYTQSSTIHETRTAYIETYLVTNVSILENMKGSILFKYSFPIFYRVWKNSMPKLRYMIGGTEAKT
jgi:uncharacterized protein YbcI